MKKIFAVLSVAISLLFGASAYAQLPSTVFVDGQQMHVQGIALDQANGYMYFSFTNRFIKTDLAGNIIGSIDRIQGHLGAMTLSPIDGRVYASLECKDDEIGSNIAKNMNISTVSAGGSHFYVAIIDVAKIDRLGMDPEKDRCMWTVNIAEAAADYNAEGHRYGCSGIDGITFAPKRGKRDGKMYLYVAYGIYQDVDRTDNDNQVILCYDPSAFAKYETPVVFGHLHDVGPRKPLKKYFIHTGNTNWGVQNLAWDASTGYMFMAVYKGKKPEYPNYDLFAFDWSKKEIADYEMYGWHYKWGSTGLCPLGNGLWYISENKKDKQTKLQSCTARLNCFNGFLSKVPFSPVTVQQVSEPSATAASTVVPAAPATDASIVVAGETPVLPRHEMRAVWVATVANIDWPKGKYDAEEQKALYISLLDHYASLNLNAIFFQVRPTADAYYESEYEPWSRYITGRAGRAPSYEIMRFLIDECHARGMEFHAWINPYRIAKRNSANEEFPELDSKIPVWLTKDYQTIRVYNPALPETRARICDIVREIITRYDVDGIHMDDYFYPYLVKGEPMDDDAEYSQFGAGYNTIEDFRRGNVTKMVGAVHQTIAETRPEVIFSVSPQGNYYNNFNSQYIDVPECCSKGYIDIVIPQLYWSTTAKKDYYTPRLDWFSDNIGNTKLMVGHATYRFDGTQDGFDSSEQLKTQFDLAYAKKNYIGSVFYNGTSVYNDYMGINAVMKEQYGSRALTPCVHDNAKPADVPAGLRISKEGVLEWERADGAVSYAVYRSNGDAQTATLLGTTKGLSFQLPSASAHYFVTSLTQHRAESAPSVIVKY